MFTGIIEKTVRVVGLSQAGAFQRLTLATDWDDLRVGESVAVNGCCLTVAEVGDGEVGFDVVAETLSRTNLGMLESGELVHVERSLRVGDRIDGHFVQGHVDGTATLLDQAADESEWRLRVESPAALSKYLAPKGSVALDGVSLTIAKIEGNVFEVALIPTTVQRTALAKREAGWPFNLEVDILSKTVVHYLELRGAG